MKIGEKADVHTINGNQPQKDPLQGIIPRILQ